MHSLDHFRTQYPFPNPENWPPDEPLAWGGSLVPGRLISAYSQGIFPWYNSQEPILWWSPDPRCVLFVDRLDISRSLARELKKSSWEVRVDTQFQNVIKSCASTIRPRQKGTWITEEMIAAYQALHQTGVAHSVEVYCEGALVGGLYGVSFGKIFFGESMFSHKTNASKVALVYLIKLLKHWQFELIDCQIRNAHLISLGAEDIRREDFLKHLKKALAYPTHLGPWTETFENLLHKRI